jgi:chaperone modulatory protein CbpM
MMRITAVVAMFDGLEETDVLTWVERGWVRPQWGSTGDATGNPTGDPIFEDIDIARVRLIHDLLFRMDLREDAIPLILGLLDQVYDLRAIVRTLTTEIGRQPANVRDAILAGLRHSR